MFSVIQVINVAVSQPDTLSTAVRHIDVGQRLLGMSLSVAAIVVPTVASILIFIIGQLIDNFFTNRKIKIEIVNETKNNRDVILEWINLSEESIRTLADHCIDLSRNISSLDNIMHVPLTINSLSIGRMGGLSLEFFSKSLVITSMSTKGKKIDDSNLFNLISEVDFLQKIDRSIVENYDNYGKQAFELQKEWNNNLNDLKDMVHKKTVYSDKNYIDNLQVKVLSIFNKWIDDVDLNGTSVSSTVKGLIGPLMQLVVEETRNGNSNSYTLELYAPLRNIKEVDAKWETLKVEYTNVFNSIGIRISHACKTLVEAKEYFEKDTRVKDWWNVR